MIAVAALSFLLQSLQISPNQELKVTSRKLSLMGSQFEVIAVHHDKQIADQSLSLAIKEIARIESMISSWSPLSYTSEINRQAGIKPVPVPLEMFQLVRRAKRVSELTQGAFSLSFASVYHLYDFNRSGFRLPDTTLTDPLRRKTDYRNIVLNEPDTSIFLKLEGMKIGFGAIGKGYAADRAKRLMIEMGIEAGCVNAGGDLITWGYRPDGEPWNIGISDPKNPNEYLAYIPTSDQAIVTSGDYENYFEYEGERYSHIIDPRSCRPVKEIASATVICPSTELADALATAVCVLGMENGLALIENLKGIEAIVIDQHGNKRATSNITLEKY